ncbi:MAG: secG [Clostridia bacterium]|jgi:preprotein translocase subunit SecG|nr:secG [Clostridia bacterium]
MAIAKIVITIIYLIAALAIITVVLLQEGKSAGLGSIGGGANSSNSYWDKNKKHSLEGKFERWTKITAAIFVLLALILMLMR